MGGRHTYNAPIIIVGKPTLYIIPGQYKIPCRFNYPDTVWNFSVDFYIESLSPPEVKIGTTYNVKYEKRVDHRGYDKYWIVGFRKTNSKIYRKCGEHRI